MFRGVDAERRGDPWHPAGMLDHEIPPPVLIRMNPKAQPIRRGRVAESVQGEALVHQVDGRVREDLTLVGEMVLKMKHAESDQIVRAGVDRRSTVVVEGIEWDRSTVVIVALGRVRLERGADIDRGVGETQREEYFGPHEIGIGLPGDPTDDVVNDPETEVRIAEGLARR